MSGPINSRKKTDKNLTALIYRWGELLTQSCDITDKECRDKLKIDLFSIQLWNEKIAYRVI